MRFQTEPNQHDTVQQAAGHCAVGPLGFLQRRRSDCDFLLPHLARDFISNPCRVHRACDASPPMQQPTRQRRYQGVSAIPLGTAAAGCSWSHDGLPLALHRDELQPGADGGAGRRASSLATRPTASTGAVASCHGNSGVSQVSYWVWGLDPGDGLKESVPRHAFTGSAWRDHRRGPCRSWERTPHTFGDYQVLAAKFRRVRRSPSLRWNWTSFSRKSIRQPHRMNGRPFLIPWTTAGSSIVHIAPNGTGALSGHCRTGRYRIVRPRPEGSEKTVSQSALFMSQVMPVMLLHTGVASCSRISFTFVG